MGNPTELDLTGPGAPPTGLPGERGPGLTVWTWPSQHQTRGTQKVWK